MSNPQQQYQEQQQKNQAEHRERNSKNIIFGFSPIFTHTHIYTYEVYGGHYKSTTLSSTSRFLFKIIADSNTKLSGNNRKRCKN